MRFNKLSDKEKRSAKLIEIAKAAAKIEHDVDPFEMILEGIRKVPEQLQKMLDTIVAMQDEFPMPQEGWEQFVKDIEYTNEKHGLNLQIRKPDETQQPGC